MDELNLELEISFKDSYTVWVNFPSDFFIEDGLRTLWDSDFRVLDIDFGDVTEEQNDFQLLAFANLTALVNLFLAAL